MTERADSHSSAGRRLRIVVAGAGKMAAAHVRAIASLGGRRVGYDFLAARPYSAPAREPLLLARSGDTRHGRPQAV
jgi:hypothetical protein